MSDERPPLGSCVTERLSGRAATVTEHTERGYKWRLMTPQSLGRYGSYQEGETYCDHPHYPYVWNGVRKMEG